MGKCCEQALPILPEAEEGLVIDHAEGRLLLLLTDTFEGQESMKRAHEYDEKARKVLFAGRWTEISVDFAACRRREALQLLGAGRTVQAINILGMVTELCEFQLDSWISLMQLHVLEPMLAALKVLADALGRSGTPSPRPSARSGGSRLIRKSPRRGWRAQYTA